MIAPCQASKPAFRDTARHYAALGKHGRKYASLLASAALDPGDTFTTAELAGATRALPPQGLYDTAQALVIALEGAGDQRATYWTNRVARYLHTIWPKANENRSPRIAESLGRLCLAAQDTFPDAVARLRPWLSYLPQAWLLVDQLNEAGLCGKHPEAALDFLDHILGGHSQFQKEDLQSCLAAISDANPLLVADYRFQRLYALSI